MTYIPPELDDMETLFESIPHSGINFNKYDDIPVKVTGDNPPRAIAGFEEAGLLEQCASNVRRAKFTKPTPIQKHSIPIVLSGRDLMACAQTGSGKTVRFWIFFFTFQSVSGVESASLPSVWIGFGKHVHVHVELM